MGVQIVKLLDKLNPTIVTGGLVPRGAYNGATAYAIGDSVSYNGSSYIAIASTTGNLPTDTTKWMVLANGTTSSGSGDVVGPATSTSDAVAVYADGTGKLLRNSILSVGTTGATLNGGLVTDGLIVNNSIGTTQMFNISDGNDLFSSSTGIGSLNSTVPNYMPMLGLDEVTDANITAEQLYSGGSAIFMDAADHKVKVHVNGNTTPQTIAYTTDLRSRSVNSISSPTTAGATANTDYIYLVSGTTTLTLPTAAGNTNRYTVKNTGSATVTIATTSSQTIDGSSTASLPVQYTSLDLISDGSNWNVI